MLSTPRSSPLSRTDDRIFTNDADDMLRLAAAARCDVEVLAV
jgi:hypothetical protein